MASALVFLDINGFDFECSEDEIYETMMEVASGKMSKLQLAAQFAKFSKKRT